jgi:phenylacetate-CoA ligase
MGRADQTTKVKGMFVHPQQIAEILRRHPQVKKARLVVDRINDNDAMTLKCEAAQGAASGSDALVQALAETVHALLKLHGKVEIVKPGSLPNDGKVIEDTRKIG